MAPHPVTSGLFTRLKEVIDIPPLAVNPAHSHLRERLDDWRQEVPKEVKRRKCYDEIDERAGPFKDEVQIVKNDLRALDLFDNRTELIGWYLDFCLPTPEKFVDRVLRESPREESHVTAWTRMDVEEKQTLARRVHNWVMEKRNNRQQPEGTPAGHNPSPASLPPASHPPSASSSANPVTGHEHHQAAFKPLDLACRAVIANCINAGVNESTWRLWLARIKNITANAGTLPPDAQRQVVLVVGTAATVIGYRATGPCRAVTAEDALWDCYDLIKEELHRHNSAALHSLGTSSRPYHHLSLRQRVIYPRAFTSFSAY